MDSEKQDKFYYGCGDSSDSDEETVTEEELPLAENLWDKIEERKGKALIVCEDYEKPCPISILPMELIVTILKKIVENVEDLYHIEDFSKVCAAFFLASRDNVIWKNFSRLCLSPRNYASISKSKIRRDWLDVFLIEPLIRYDGFYVCDFGQPLWKELENLNMERCDMFTIPHRYYVMRFFTNGNCVCFSAGGNTLPDLTVATNSFMLRGTYSWKEYNGTGDDEDWFAIDNNRIVVTLKEEKLGEHKFTFHVLDGSKSKLELSNAEFTSQDSYVERMNADRIRKGLCQLINAPFQFKSTKNFY